MSRDFVVEYRPAGMLRRLAAIFYDTLLLFAVLFFAAMPMVYLNGGEGLVYQAYLLGVCYLYFAWPWVRGGQTLGMKAWRMRLLTPEKAPVSWRHTGLRFALALLSWLCLGLGFWRAWFDAESRTWHDLGSGTRLYAY
jgi:uncharacterized RDD family membrane protein YckC